MKIFRLEANVDDYNYFGFINENHWDDKVFDGKELLNNWVSPKVKLYRTKKYPLGDIVSLTTLNPAINVNVIEILKDIFCNNVELLPIVFDEQYYLMNVINLLDALDEEKSEFKRYSSGKIMYCTKYVFREDIIRNIHIFKIPQFPKTDILVTEGFVKLVQDNNLKGFEFEELWDSET